MKALAKVFTVTKNEYDLIEDFIVYHGTIFGYDNVVIIDNGSDNPIVLDVYERYTKRGVTIYNTIGYTGEKQGEHFTTYMKRYTGAAEFLIGLDTDCFFTVRTTNATGSHWSSDKEVIIRYLSSLPIQYDIFKMNAFLMSVVDTNSPNYKDNKLTRPTDCTTFVLRDGYAGFCVSHVFFRASNFVRTCNGNHSGVSTKNKQFHCVDIAYVHYHDTGKRRQLERCKAILTAYGYIGETMSEKEQLSALLTTRNNIGIHRQRQYVRYLQYHSSFFEEEPIPPDVFEHTEIKGILDSR